jgi:hypothetical protein
MSKQTINIGTAANAKNGDSLRAAFNKVNANFTELYTALGLDSGGLNLGAFEFVGSTLSTTDSSAIVIDQAATITSNLTVGGDVLPSVALGGDLGSSARPWRSLYVSNNTIFLGGTALSVNGAGNLLVNGSLITGGGGGSSLVNGANTVSLGSDGMLTLPNGLALPGGAGIFGSGGGYQITDSANSSYFTFDAGGFQLDTYNGSNIRLRTTPVGTSDYKDWIFNSNGNLSFPDGSNQHTAYTGSAQNIASESDVSIEINLTDSTLRRWSFGEDGLLTFPDGTNQATAFPGTYAQSGATSAYATKRILQYNPSTNVVTYSNYIDAASIYITGYGSEIHVSPVAFDNTGNGTIGDPVKTIAKALELAALAFETTAVGQRKTIILHPGDYVENVTLDTQYIVLTTHESIGKNTSLSGTLTISKGCTVNGLKMTNLVISATSATGSVDIINCTVTTATTKTSSAYTNFRLCDLSSSTLSITGAGSVVLNGGNFGSLTVNNASAGVLAKAVITLGPTTLTAGILQLSDTLIYSATNTSNAITQSAGSFLTVNNCQTLIPDLSTVARNSFGGYYSILHSVYDKANSTFGGTSLSAVSYSQYVNADRLILASGGQITFPNATTQTTAWTGSVSSLVNGARTASLGSDGALTIPGDIKSNSNINIDINLADSTLRRWSFGEDGDTVFPNNISIDYGGGNNILYPRIIADSGKAFSVQGQGETGSAALAWSVDPESAGQYAQIGATKGGGDNLAKVVIQAQSNSGDGNTAKIWKFDETGALTIPGDIRSEGNINIDINLSDSTLRRWQFGEDGHLTLPSTGKISNSGYDWTFGSNGSLTFPDNTISTGKGITIPEDQSLTVNLSASGPGPEGQNNTFKINPESIKLPTGNGIIFSGTETDAGEWGLDSGNKILRFPNTGDGVYPQILYSVADNVTGMQLLTYAKSIKITAASNKSWTFGTDGSLTLPGDIKSNGNINIEVNLSDSTLRRWQFGEDGILTVPGPISGLGNAKLDFTTYANVAYLTSTSDDTTALYMGSVSAELYAQTNILIRTNTNGASKQWTFSDDGGLTLPGSITLTNGAVIKDTAGEAVAFGSQAGLTSQSSGAVAVGNAAGQTTQGAYSVAIGTTAGLISQGQNAVAIGVSAGETSQSVDAVAIGNAAGLSLQGANTVAIGVSAGNTGQGAGAVAIGYYAGGGTQGVNSVAIGYAAGYNGQAANSIVINATGSVLNQATANTFTVAPIRNISATSGVLQYNASTKEVSYSNSVTAERFNTDQITVVGNRISTTVTNANLEIECNGSGGVVINTLADATTASTVKSVGYLGLPQSATATSATLAIGDAGKHIYVTTNSQTITIPANASVAYPIGTTLTFIAGPSATTVLIAITSDTLRLAGGTSTGQRTLAANGMATAVKVAATTWYINGTGLT